jgi:hypothetical protein
MQLVSEEEFQSFSVFSQLGPGQEYPISNFHYRRQKFLIIALGNVGEGGVMGAVVGRAAPFKCDVIQYNKINSPRV